MGWATRHYFLLSTHRGKKATCPLTFGNPTQPIIIFSCSAKIESSKGFFLLHCPLRLPIRSEIPVWIFILVSITATNGEKLKKPKTEYLRSLQSIQKMRTFQRSTAKKEKSFKKSFVNNFQCQIPHKNISIKKYFAFRSVLRHSEHFCCFYVVYFVFFPMGSQMEFKISQKGKLCKISSLSACSKNKERKITRQDRRREPSFS